MNEEVKKYIHAYVINLEYLSDMLRMQGADSSIIELLDRVSTVSNISLLYSDQLSDIEFENIKAILAISETMLDLSNADNMDEKFNALSSVLERVEELFRRKKLLLDKSESIKIAA